MNRRGFIQGLGALMATSAMVRPAVADVAWSTTPFEYEGMWFNYSITPLPNGDYVSITHPSMMADLQREWNGTRLAMQRGLYGDGAPRHNLNKLKEFTGQMYVDEMGDIAYRDLHIQRWPVEDSLSCCQFEADPKDDDDAYEPCYYRRVCAHCNGVWFGLHCQHDGVQRPCPHCSIIPTQVQE